MPPTNGHAPARLEHDHPAPFGIGAEHVNGQPGYVSTTELPGRWFTTDPHYARKFSTAADAATWIDGHRDDFGALMLAVFDMRTGDVVATAKELEGAR